jgi:hypothetical protein
VSSVTWYAARSAGIVAWLLLSGSVIVGVSISARLRLAWPRFAVEDLHRFLVRLTGIFIVLHGALLLADRFLPLSPLQALVPFQSSYRPLAVGLGVVSAELLLALALATLLQRRKLIPYKLWRRTHSLTLLVWLGAGAHALLSGSDRHDPWFLALMAVSGLAVGLAIVRRFSGRLELPAAALLGATVLTALFALAFAPQPPAPKAHTIAAALPRAYTAALSARIEQQGPGTPLVSIIGKAGDAQLRVDLLVNGGQVTNSSLQLRFPSGAHCQGPLQTLSPTGLSGHCNSRTVHIAWQPTPDQQAFHGHLQLG